MSALGHKQTSAHVRVMSALPPKAAKSGHPGRCEWERKTALRRSLKGRDVRYAALDF
jgi:hypothetical protein